MGPSRPVLVSSAVAAVGGLLYVLYAQRRRAKEAEDAERLRFNFARASFLDGVAHGSLRPGLQSNTGESEGCVRDAEVAEWVSYVKSQGITKVVSFLGDDEAKWYARSVDDQMVEAFGEANYLRQSVHVDGAYAKVLAFVEAARDTATGKILFHCSGGVNRTSMGMGVWLMAAHSQTPVECETRISDAAAAFGTRRKPSWKKLRTFMDDGRLPLKTRKPRDAANH